MLSILTTNEPTRAITYIDGFNLYHGLKHRGWKRYLWLNPHALATHLVRGNQTAMQTKYFTARVGAPHDSHERQAVFLDAVATVPEIQIIQGQFRHGTTKCRQCENTWFSPEEKGTDVNIAVEMLNDAADDRVDTLILVSGDSDLAPAVTSIRERHPQKRVVIAFPPKRESATLRRVATTSFVIGRQAFSRSLFPNVVVAPGGYELHRPSVWPKPGPSDPD